MPHTHTSDGESCLPEPSHDGASTVQEYKIGARSSYVTVVRNSDGSIYVYKKPGDQDSLQAAKALVNKFREDKNLVPRGPLVADWTEAQTDGQIVHATISCRNESHNHASGSCVSSHD